MDMVKFKERLKDVSPGGKVIIVVAAIAAIALYPDSFLKFIENKSSPSTPLVENHSFQGKQINAPITANGNANVMQHFGDNNNYSIDDEAAEKIVNTLIAKASGAYKNEIENRDAQIKSLKETIQALQQQNASEYDIQQALNFLEQGDTTQAEAIFEGVAEEARLAGKQANVKEAEALRHLGSLAYLHDTQKAMNAYRRSTQLDPDNIDGWNQLGHLYQRIGELENAENAYMTV